MLLDEDCSVQNYRDFCKWETKTVEWILHDPASPCQGTKTTCYGNLCRLQRNQISGMKNDISFVWEDHAVDPKSNPLPKATENTVIRLAYQTMEVQVYSDVFLVDLNAFVSATGGALGLFLGFSIIDTLFYIYDYIGKKYK